MSDEYQRTIDALLGFRIDEISDSPHGPLVAMTLKIPRESSGDRILDIGMTPDLAIELGRTLVAIGEKTQARLQ